MTAATATNPISVSTGADYLLRNSIRFTGTDLEKAEKTIRAYSKPQADNNCFSWLGYISNNVSHATKTLLNKMTMGYFNIKSDWTKLEERTVEHFKRAAANDPELSAPYAPTRPSQTATLFASVTPRMLSIPAGLTYSIIPERAHHYATRLLENCLTAQAKDMDPTAVRELPDGRLSLEHFLTKTRGDRHALTAFIQSENGISHVLIRP